MDDLALLCSNSKRLHRRAESECGRGRRLGFCPIPNDPANAQGDWRLSLTIKSIDSRMTSSQEREGLPFNFSKLLITEAIDDTDELDAEAAEATDLKGQ
jgi:hypothetical protein